MNASELRIGNIVFEPLNENKRAFEVYELYHEKGYDKINHFNAINFEPVALTEEWLLKFDVRKRFDTAYIPCYSEDCSCAYDLVFDLIKEEPNVLVYNFKKIKYVHQLQNLYFALTGEELQIKSDE